MQEFDEIVDRRATWSSKWQKYAGRDVLPFWVADMDFRAPGFVRAAIAERVTHGVLGYTETPPELTNAVVDWCDAQFGWRVAHDSIVWNAGVVGGFNMACRAVGRPGDQVLMNVPVYYPFLSAPAHAEREALEVRLTLDRARWIVDVDALAHAVTPRTRLYLFCNPQNPTGRVYDRDELVAIARFCERHDLLICSDEIHCSLILDRERKHVPIASLSEDIAARTITLFAPSKTYNTPGLPCAFAVIPDAALRRRFVAARLGLVPGIGALAYAAALAAYNDASDWLPRLLTYLAGNRDRLEATVAALDGIAMTHVEGTYLGWIDARRLRVPSLAAHFETHGLGLSDGAQFHGPGFVRFNFGCPRATLDRGLERLANAVRAAPK